MDQVPFAFIDSVAHILPISVVSLFPAVSNSLWSNIGQTHQESRVDYELEVFCENFEITYNLRSLKTNEVCSIESLIGQDCRFMRTASIDIEDDTTTEPLFEESQVELLKSLSENIPIGRIDLRGCKDREAMSFLWKMPSDNVSISTNCPEEILKFQLFENHHLRKIEVSRSSYPDSHQDEENNYDFMRNLVESWKLGTMQELEPSEKSVECLEQLGFKRCLDEGSVCYEIIVEGHGGGKELTICFQCY
ncbi:hypothetical protein L596_009388 [Steinernema carpocapsae]|uniref:Uncharacterized protein n=1 Tax=Steinernema carpocapsae TaxID=34508 RepID=A0A4U5PFM3_STECR|nr:hypothetical protein L596_009388 [Steinernema carpocapsae]